MQRRDNVTKTTLISWLPLHSFLCKIPSTKSIRLVLWGIVCLTPHWHCLAQNTSHSSDSSFPDRCSESMLFCNILASATDSELPDLFGEREGNKWCFEPPGLGWYHVPHIYITSKCAFSVPSCHLPFILTSVVGECTLFPFDLGEKFFNN